MSSPIQPPPLVTVSYDDVVSKLPQSYKNACIDEAKKVSPGLFESGWKIGDAKPPTREAVITTLVGAIIFLLGVTLLLITHFHGINAIAGNIGGIGGMVVGIIVFAIGRIKYLKRIKEGQAIDQATTTYNTQMLSKISLYCKYLLQNQDILAIENSNSGHKVYFYWNDIKLLPAEFDMRTVHKFKTFSYREPSERETAYHEFYQNNQNVFDDRTFVNAESFEQKAINLERNSNYV